MTFAEISSVGKFWFQDIPYVKVGHDRGLNLRTKQWDPIKPTDDVTPIPGELIQLPCYQIEVELSPDGKSGKISSVLKDEDAQEQGDTYDYNVAIDTLESFVLACACAGIDITTPAFLEAIETTAQTAANQH